MIKWLDLSWPVRPVRPVPECWPVPHCLSFKVWQNESTSHKVLADIRHGIGLFSVFSGFSIGFNRTRKGTLFRNKLVRFRKMWHQFTYSDLTKVKQDCRRLYIGTFKNIGLHRSAHQRWSLWRQYREASVLRVSEGFQHPTWFDIFDNIWHTSRTYGTKDKPLTARGVPKMQARRLLLSTLRDIEMMWCNELHRFAQAMFRSDLFMTVHTTRDLGKTVTTILPCLLVAIINIIIMQQSVSYLSSIDLLSVSECWVPVLQFELQLRFRYVDEFWMTNDQLIKFPASGYHSFDADLCLQWLLQWLWCKVQSLESLKEPEMVPEMCQNTAEMLQIVRKKVLLQRTLWASLSSIWCQGNSLWADVCTQMAISEYVSRLDAILAGVRSSSRSSRSSSRAHIVV